MDEADILLVANGDSEAFERLVDRYQGPLRGWFRKRRLNLDDASELTQEVFIRVFKNAGRFKPVSFRAWIYRIAKNILTDKRRGKRRVTFDSLLADPVAAEDFYKPVEVMDEYEDLVRRLEDLSECHRSTVEGIYEGLTVPEIAEREGICVRTARSRVRLIREHVRGG